MKYSDFALIFPEVTCKNKGERKELVLIFSSLLLSKILKKLSEIFPTVFLSPRRKFRSCLHLKIIKRQTGETVISEKATEAML